MSSRLDALQKRIDRLYAMLPELEEQDPELDPRLFTADEWVELQAFLRTKVEHLPRWPNGQVDLSSMTEDDLRTLAEWQELQQARQKERKWIL